MRAGKIRLNISYSYSAHNVHIPGIARYYTRPTRIKIGGKGHALLLAGEDDNMTSHWLMEMMAMTSHWLIEMMEMPSHWLVETMDVNSHWLMEMMNMPSHWLVEMMNMTSHWLIE